MELEKTHLINYFLEICPTVLDCSRKELQSVLAKKEEEKIRRFMADKNVNLIVIGKEKKEDADNEGSDRNGHSGSATQEGAEQEESTVIAPPSAATTGAERGAKLEKEPGHVLFVELNINYKCVTKSVAIAFMKRKKENFLSMHDRIEKGNNKTNLSSELLMFVCGQHDCDTPLDLVYLYLSQGFNTIFDAASSATHNADAKDSIPNGYSRKELESSGGLAGSSAMNTNPGGNKYLTYEGENKLSNVLMTNVSKKLNELLISMKNAQIDLNIPIINLSVDRRIKELVREYPNVDEIKPDKLKALCESQEFLNHLQKDVTKWVEEIQKLTRLNGDFKSGSALAEINFWIGYENALLQLENQLRTPEVLLTLQILKSAKRYFATMSFDSDIQLKQSKEYVLNVNILMKDFPIDDLLGAQTVQQIIQAVRIIFTHLKKLKNTTKYPLSRSYNFVEALSRDLGNTLKKVLLPQALLSMDYQEFDVLISGCMEVFRLWNDEMRVFKDMVRELIKKRSFNERAPAKMVFEHINLQERLDEIRKFRKQHQKFKMVITKVFGDDRTVGVNLLKDINSAYDIFLPLDALDLSKTGEELWEKSKISYESRINKVESQITFKLRDQLGGAKTSTEMFNAFSKFNPLFFRPKIRGAIQEYQNSLIQIVVDDLRKLQMVYINGYVKSPSEKVSTIRDIPLVAGSIIWAKQIERKLEDSLKRIENVLGRGWEQHSEGKNLRQSIDNFKTLLSQNKTFEKWLKGVKSADKFDIYEKIIKIKKLGVKNFEIVANYDFEFFNLFKEVRYLQSINLRVPYSIKVKADETKLIYPYALTLQKTFRSYMKICLFMENEAKAVPFNSTITKLVASIHNNVQAKIKEGIGLHWDSDVLETYVRKLTEVVNTFESMVDEAVRKNSFVLDTLDRIKVCEITMQGDEVTKLVKSIQEKADELYLEHYRNVHIWIDELNILLNKILTSRLEEVIKAWTGEFVNWTSGFQKGKKFIMKETTHEFKIINQKFYLHPSIDTMRQMWYTRLAQAINIICGIPRVKNIYQKKDRTKETIQIRKEKDSDIASDIILDNTYRHIIYFIDKKVYDDAIECINDTVEKARKYESMWLQYNTLWKIEIGDIITSFGEDIEAWKGFMNEIKETEYTFDTLNTEKNFGPIVIDYRILQSKVSSKFENWQKEIVSEFSKKLSEKIVLLKAEIEKALDDLTLQAEVTNESDITAMHILSMAPKDIIAIINTHDMDVLSKICNSVYKFIEKINEISTKGAEWDSRCDVLKQSEVLLEKHRYVFPISWVHIDNVIGKVETVNQICSYQIKLVKDYYPYIQSLVLEFDTNVQNSIKVLFEEWNKNKPSHGNTNSTKALQIISAFESRIDVSNGQYEISEKIKKLMKIRSEESENGFHVSPNILKEEIACVKGIWDELKSIYSTISEMKKMLWCNVEPKNVKNTLNGLLDCIKRIPAKYRQYEIFDNVQEEIQQYLKTYGLLLDLKSESLKDRHWRLILHKLQIKIYYNKLTLGNLWSLNLSGHENALREILNQSQGEMALEEFLRGLKDTWNEYELELVQYQNKCKLIKGWNDIFSTIDDHLNALQSMKISSYVKIFEEETLTWDEKLNRLRNLLDVWMNVQRKWVYLEGVLKGSSDIKSLLPQEYNRFKIIDTDFINIMRKTSEKPKLMELFQMEGFQKQLDRLSDSLSKIQKALGEYLEKQRNQFPRFYFVGDEDLLEMIGNSKDAKVIQRNVNKMFAGISSFIIKENTSDVILGMSSREGEEIFFEEPICLSAYKTLKEWLITLESYMKATLQNSLDKAAKEILQMDVLECANCRGNNKILEWASKYPNQIVLLCLQILWTSNIEGDMQNGDTSGDTSSNEQNPGKNIFQRSEKICVSLLEFLAVSVVKQRDHRTRQKIVQMITELVHQRDVIRVLIEKNVRSVHNFTWLQYMRFYWDSSKKNSDVNLLIKMADATFEYGYEYLGMCEKLVQTKLTDACFLTLTQALKMKLGGNPFGPAGTGKTESVKALGAQLGRYVLVFNCDESFDFTAMGRIFVGLCQVGAWGCFDEFNRLEERILSAVSEQILTIQMSLAQRKKEIEILNKKIGLNKNVGIFVTMNPGYAGRSNLPDNLKQLFRSFAMIEPNKQLIVEVTLFSQGFISAEHLSSKIVSLFELCSEQLSKQPHYDFGLRSLKSVLNSAGNLKRQALLEGAHGGGEEGTNIDNTTGINKEGENAKTDSSTESIVEMEQNLLLKSVCDTVYPKLVSSDILLIRSLLTGVFPNINVAPFEEKALVNEIHRICKSRFYTPEEKWVTKICQIYQIMKLQHGVMLVGDVGTGKSSAWKVLLDAMEALDNIKGVSYIIDAKSLDKEEIYGKLDNINLEWTDGVFTAILRKILYNSAQSGNATRRHWIIFDGDVDPEWAENLNSVLDDNKLLTLPNGERLPIPESVRILFEVDTLKHATLATVSRCGMIWFSRDILSPTLLFKHKLAKLKYGNHDYPRQMDRFKAFIMNNNESTTIRNDSAHMNDSTTMQRTSNDSLSGSHENIRMSDNLMDHMKKNSHIFFDENEDELNVCSPNSIASRSIKLISDYFEENEFVHQCLLGANNFDHVMDYEYIRAIESTFLLLEKGIDNLVVKNEKTNNAITDGDIEKYISKWLVMSILWGIGGSLNLEAREKFSIYVESICSIPLPTDLSRSRQMDDTDSSGAPRTLLDYEPSIEDGEWHCWKERVEMIDVDRGEVSDATLVIETMDTIRHATVLEGWLNLKKPFILCGPPGSGKTMTLTSVLKKSSEFDIAALNFSSGSLPNLLLQTFDHYCEYVKTTSELVLRPVQPGKWLIIFADEINLPTPDKYDTQRIIMFMRQIYESQGFWKYDSNNNQWNWVKIERITFAGACNPPTDAGRNPLSNRFLRHTAILYVDFPGYESLKQIYGTFNRAILRKFGDASHMADNLTLAMVNFYTKFSETFTIDMQPHYIYSPRELTRWKLALYETLEHCDHLEKRDLVRLCICEGLRIFQDRLIYKKEKKQTDKIIDDIFKFCFPGIGEADLQRPILFTSYVQNEYKEIDKRDLKELIKAKLKVFNEEEINVQLVLFDDVLDHITRIDRVLRLPLGHLLLVGASGAGKTILSRFVSWINGLSVFQIRAGRNYCTESFEADLRNVMKRSGIKEEKITFIFDESNVLGPAFLERMNALLASGEVPGLFEGDNYTTLINECKAAYGSNVGLDESDIFKKFTKQVQKNLHIVFTMNPANPDFANRQATSPALFNRCVIDWFGDWPYSALLQVASEFIYNLDLPDKNFHMDSVEEGPIKGKIQYKDNKSYYLSRAIVEIHNSVVRINGVLLKKGSKYNYMTPRDFLDFIKHFLKIIEEKKEEVSDQKKHLNLGLSKLKDTEVQVAELRNSLAINKKTLAEKDTEAEEKMKLMIEQQAETEDKKKKAEILAKKLDEQFIIIEQRKEIVRKELSEVEPKFREAEEAVKNIPKKNFDELRAMANPPILVRNAVEAVAILIMNEGDKSVTWEDARKIMKGQDFINKVLYLDKKMVKPQTSGQIKKRLSHSDWDVDRINKASRAAGPLAKWVESVITFLNILETVQPLENEIEKLQEETRIAEDQYNEQKDIISELEKKLVQYKNDYAQLISQVQSIKQEMENVENKIKRSINLIENLKSEKERWSETFINLEAASETFVGDCLIAAAFCAYIGFFEHYERQKLKKTWGEIIKMHHIKHRHDLSFIEFLSNPSERLQWIANELPSDELSIENAIIIKSYIRYPMIIDPSDQASTFLLNQYREKKIVKTSFSDKNFIKNLESALRFGSTLLVYDVEKVDAILNSVLNQETHKQGGRLLITIGDSEIDYSPAFNLFLTSRDAHFQFTPDLCSRVTFVNFTLTPSSLQNQCLNMILKNERPDIDKKRCDLLKLQGEYKVKIRELEESLLLELSNVKGNILDDDNVISTMEKLKVQAAEASREVNIAEEVMVEIENVSNQYLFLAQGSARIYFILQHLGSINFLYQYDLNFFFNLMKDMLRKEELPSNVKKNNNYQERLMCLEHLLFSLTYNRVARGLLQEDRYVFALQLCYVKGVINPGIYIDPNHLHFLLKDHYGSHHADTAVSSEEGNKIEKGLLPDYTDEQISTLNNLAKHKSFANLRKSITNDKEKWIQLIHSTEPEQIISSIMNGQNFGVQNGKSEESREVFNRNTDPQYVHNLRSSDNINMFMQNGGKKEEQILACLKESLIIKAIRPDKLDKCFNKLINVILGKDFLWIPELSTNEFEKYVKENASGNIPIVLISAPGFDPSNKVQQLSEKCRVPLFSIAMGSEEGYISAEKIISSAQKNGGWVLLKNIHLSPKWLHQLEKNIHKATTNQNFRLFLTMEINPKIPPNLLRISLTFMFEPPVGIKSSILRTFSLFLENRNLDDPKIARMRLYFLVSFLHAIILERRRYTPIGWTKGYEFGDSDLSCALSVVDNWLDRASTKIGKSVIEHIDPSNIPWDAIKKILNEVVYGGRLDNLVDSKILDTFIEHLMNSNSFEADFKLNICKSSSEKDLLNSPDLFRHLNDYLKWTTNMSNTDLPAWLGFGKQAEGLLTTRTNFSILSKWNILYSKSGSDVYEPLPHAPLTKVLGEESNLSMELYRKGDKRILDVISPDDGDVTKGAIMDLGEEDASSSEEGELFESSIARTVTHRYSQNENVLFINQILDSLPEYIPELERNEENMSNAVFRCFERENHLFRNLLKVIRGNLNQLKNVLEEKLKYTNKLRALAKDLNSFNVPPSWLVDGNATNLNLTNWIRELINRFYQIIVITTELNESRRANLNKQKSMHRGRARGRSSSRTFSNDLTLEAYHQKNNDTITAHFKLDKKLSIHFIWLGGLFYPRAFITATRQLCASKFKNSLDDLELSVAIGPSSPEMLDDTVHFTITCLSIEGAQWSDLDECLILSDELAIDLPPVTITWEKKETLNKKISEKCNSSFMELPIYLDKSRRSFIGFWKFPVSRGVLQENWYQRGVAIFLSKTY
ncbi:dynein heavy chain, putative [Plasmodium knowlesi strain H]|uniref:Dynein heavy chain, putative n=3 Tax=Plasmodium knowlesi TaxID=5850 RepID=A0A1A7W5A1_PLAKH|nr:dynein heavy chain, putative [Plasmodium knowlesi strain H]OTN66318.1 putative Dynein heavy chain [Plasmodium knowlesi]CAA9986414.1 dynein heavy chain, putative [Plasmodium knowlesi strain H]SBO27182.1 dynein heavy chain, putative [Plasmodium knowlesi strain H]SBO29549.1 dynein heavy chain, putative [Plasmodium knowlesi strain H]VVS75888.1 dynein heavy chain, putative [Plasmodium knowlesi strain H]